MAILSDGDLDPPDRGRHAGAEFEELQADGSAGGLRELGAGQSDAAQGRQQNIGERREPQTQSWLAAMVAVEVRSAKRSSWHSLIVGWTPPADGIDVPAWEGKQPRRGDAYTQVATIGFDIAKNSFQVHGADDRGKVVLRRKLSRGKELEFFANLPRCWSAWRLAAAHIIGRAS
jgi:hypothetical protein